MIENVTKPLWRLRITFKFYGHDHIIKLKRGNQKEVSDIKICLLAQHVFTEKDFTTNSSESMQKVDLKTGVPQVSTLGSFFLKLTFLRYPFQHGIRV